MIQSPIQQAIADGAEWLEANKNHPDAEAFGCVAAAVADLARIAYGKKETAGDAAAINEHIHFSRAHLDALGVSVFEVQPGVIDVRMHDNDLAKQIAEILLMQSKPVGLRLLLN